MESSISTVEISKTDGTETSERHSGFGKQVHNLLPGISDEITLEKICTKLPWRALKVLFLVSPTWQKVFEDRQIYDARVRAGSTETLLVHAHDFDSRISLYSTRDDCCYRLPPIPHLGGQIPWKSACVGLDGKIYVIGGRRRPGPGLDDGGGSAWVFALDLTGHMEWKECAKMLERRLGFGCGVSDGKIYVFGGTSNHLPVRGSEVYDPKENSWSPIMPMPSFRFNHRVAAVGEELFAFSGDYYDPDIFEWNEDMLDPYDPDNPDEVSDHVNTAWSLEIYHRTKNEWRVVEYFQLYRHVRIFISEGQLHSMNRSSVDVYDIDKGSWTERQTHSFLEYRLHRSSVEPREALAVNNDLFAAFNYSKKRGGSRRTVSLFRSKGFDGGEEELLWHKTSCPGLCADFAHMSSISL